MRLCYTALALVLASGIAIAQDVDQKSKTKVKVDDGKSTTVTGCIERNADGGFMLTNVAGKDGARGSYLLAATTDDNDLDDIHKHVGERVEITGKAADQGKGKLKVETKAEGTSWQDREQVGSVRRFERAALSGREVLPRARVRVPVTRCGSIEPADDVDGAS